MTVGLSARQPQAESQWHLFNDFLVRPVEKKEALHFATTWKMPTVLIYQHQSASNAIDDTWKQSLDTTCLFQNWSLKYAYSSMSLNVGLIEQKPIRGSP